MAKEAYYFKHDSNASRDPKIREMRAVYRAEGVGMYWMLLELMREQETYTLPKIGRYWLNALADELRCDAERLGKFIEDCIGEFGLFKSDDKCFWSESFIRRMDERGERSRQARSAAVERWKNDHDAPDGASAYKTEQSASILDADSLKSDAHPIQSASILDAIRKREERENRREEKRERDAREKNDAAVTSEEATFEELALKDDEESALKADREERKRFVPPTVSECQAYFVEQKYLGGASEGERFWNYYENIGWCVGRKRVRMKYWHLSASNWNKGNQDRYHEDRYLNASQIKPSARAGPARGFGRSGEPDWKTQMRESSLSTLREGKNVNTKTE